MHAVELAADEEPLHWQLDIFSTMFSRGWLDLSLLIDTIITLFYTGGMKCRNSLDRSLTNCSLSIFFFSHFIYNFKMKLAVIATLAAGASAFAPTAQVSVSL